MNPTSNTGAFSDLVPSSGTSNNAGRASNPFSDLMPGGTPAQSAPVQQSQSLSDKIWGGIAGGVKAFGSVTGANAIGDSIGTAAFNVGQMAQGKNPFANPEKLPGGQPAPGVNPASQVDIPKTIGGYGQAALSVVSPEVGGGATAGGRIAANAALGAGLGATGQMAEGNTDLGSVAQGAAVGGLTGGAISAAAEGASSLVSKLPTWFTKSALPKLDTTNPANTDYALNNTKILGNADTLLSHSKTAIKSYEGQIQSILSHPEYTSVAADTPSIVQAALGKFPNSEYTSAQLFDNAKKIAPEVTGLIKKVEAGQANLQEINTVRKALDSATKSVYTTLNRPPQAKTLGAALAGAMRDYVQTTAPETALVFANYSKEIGLNQALSAIVKKNNMRPTLGDIGAGIAGYEAGGIKGALGGIALERLGGSTGGRLAAAKGAQALIKAAPAANALIQGAKAPVISAASQ